MPVDGACPIDRAKALANGRIEALHLDRTIGSMAPVFTGLPITGDEATYLAQCVLEDLRGKAATPPEGVSFEQVLAGAIQWSLLVGILAGKEA